MPTSSIRCPACGAADPSPADAAGVHACVYCGSRYRMNLQGRATVLPGKAPPGTNPGKLFGAFMVALVLGAAITGFLAFRTEDEPEKPEVAFELDLESITGKEVEAPPQNEDVSLTPAEATPEPEPDATATFEEHHRKNSGGALWIYGTTTNTSPFVVDKVEVIAVLKDAAGKELGTKSGFAARDALAPGATSPVTILLKDTPEFASLDWELDVDKASWVPKMVSGLRVEAGSPTKNSWGAWEVEGKVHNEGSQSAKFVKVEMSGWSAQDKLLGLGDAYTKGKVLKPGASARFKHVGVHFDVDPTRFELHVEGRVAD